MEKRRLIVYIITCFIASVHLGAIVPLFSFVSHDLEMPSSVSGLVAAMTPLGGLVVTFFSEKLVRRIGFQRAMVTGIVSQLGLLALLIMEPYSLPLWMIVRFLLGVTFSLIFMPPQASIALEEERKKAFYVNLLGVVFGLGLTAGPLLTNLKAVDVRAPLIAIAGMYVIILILVGSIRNTYPPPIAEGTRPLPRLRILRIVWIAMLPAVLFGFCELSLTAIFPIEARIRQFSEPQAALIVSLFPLFALIGQLPVSLLADRFGPRRVAPFLYAAAGIAFLLPLAHYSYPSLLAAGALCGLAIGHGYYFCVSFVNSISDRDTVVSANILIEAIYNVFVIFVPPLVGVYLQQAEGTTVFLPLMVMAVLILIVHLLFNRSNRKLSL
jgi:MFS family permease